MQRPYLLYELLGEFASREISLAYLQSLPKEGSLEEFTFYAEIFGHRTNEKIKEAFHFISKKNFLSYWKVLGSYPRHEF